MIEALITQEWTNSVSGVGVTRRPIILECDMRPSVGSQELVGTLITQESQNSVSMSRRDMIADRSQ